MGYVGFNALTQQDKDKLKNFVRTKQPDIMVVMNDPAYATELINLGTQTKVIQRIRYDADEFIHEMFRDAREWWDYAKAVTAQHGQTLDKRGFIYIGNELNGNMAKVNKFLIDATALVIAEGFAGVVIGNFSVGVPEPSHIQNDLRGIADLATSNPKVYLGLHEYLHISPYLGVEGYVWRDGRVVDTTPSKPLAARSKWIVGRYENWFKYGSSPKLMFTEWGSDNVQAVVAMGVPTAGGWRKVYNNDVNGWFTLSQHTMDVFYKHPKIFGFAQFSLGDSGGWADYNYAGADRFFSEGINFNGVETVVADPNYPIGKTLDVASLNANLLTRIRATPKTGTVVGSVPADFTKGKFTNKVNESDGTWYNVVLEGGTNGWTRGDLVKIQNIQEPVDLPYIPIPAPELKLDEMSATERKNTAELFRYFGAVFTYFAEQVENYK